jgi:hypothetical protein
MIMYPSVHLLLALMEWGLLAISIRLSLRSPSLSIILLPILLLNLSYDNLVLGLGHGFGTGETLKALSYLRFLLHLITVPGFVILGVELAHQAGAKWASKPIRLASWGLAIALAQIGIAKSFIGLNLSPVDFLGVLRYTNLQPHGMPWITILVNVFVLAIGLGLWFRLRWQWLFWGALVSLIGNAVPSAVVGTLLSSGSECLFAIALVSTEYRILANPHRSTNYSISHDIQPV